MVCKCFCVEQAVSNRGHSTLVEKYTRKSSTKLKAHNFSCVKDK